MSDPDVERTLGAHEARLNRLELDAIESRRSLSEFRAEWKADSALMSGRLAIIHDAVTSARGGWKALAAIGALVAIMASGITAVYHMLWR